MGLTKKQLEEINKRALNKVARSNKSALPQNNPTTNIADETLRRNTLQLNQTQVEPLPFVQNNPFSQNNLLASYQAFKQQPQFNEVQKFELRNNNSYKDLITRADNLRTQANDRLSQARNYIGVHKDLYGNDVQINTLKDYVSYLKNTNDPLGDNQEYINKLYKDEQDALRFADQSNRQADEIEKIAEAKIKSEAADYTASGSDLAFKKQRMDNAISNMPFNSEARNDIARDYRKEYQDVTNYKIQEDMWNNVPQDLRNSVQNAVTNNDTDTASKLLKNNGYSDNDIYTIVNKAQINADNKLAQQEAKQTKEFAKKHPVLASLDSVGNSLNPINNINAVKELLGYRLNQSVRIGNDNVTAFNKNNEAQRKVNERLLERETVGQNINSDIGRSAYNIGMSTVDNIARMVESAALDRVLPGSGRILNGLLASLDVGASQIKEGEERGLNTAQIASTALSNAINEQLFETLSFDKVVDSGVVFDNAKNFFKSLLKSAGIEGSEEVFTDVANSVSDEMMNGEQSELRTQYRALLNQGLSEKEAKKEVLKGYSQQLAESFIAGAVSGGLMTGGMAGVNYAKNRAVNNKTLEDAGNNIIKAGNNQRLKNLVDNMQINNEKTKAIANNTDWNNALSVGHTITELINYENDVTDNIFKTNMHNELAKKLSTLKDNDGNAIEGVEELADRIMNGLSYSPYDSVQSVIKDYKNFIQGKTTESNNYLENINTANLKQHSNNLATLARLTTERVKSANTENKTTKEQKSLKTQNKASQSIVGKNEKSYVLKNPNQKFDILTIAVDKNGQSKVIASGSHEQFNPDDVALDEKTAKLYEVGKKYSPKVRQAFFASAEDGISSVENYAAAFDEAYKTGEKGLGLETAYKNATVTLDLNRDQVERAYNAGLDSYTQNAQIRTKEVQKKNNTYTGTVDTSKIDTTKLNDVQKSAIKVIESIANNVGVDIELFESKADNEGRYVGENGSYNINDNKIRIDINAGLRVEGEARNTMVITLAHELTHSFEYNAPETYAQLQEYVFNNLAKSTGQTAEELIYNEVARLELKDEKNGLNKKTKEKYEEIAKSEIVARGCERILTDEAAIKELAYTNQGLFGKIKAWIEQLCENLRNAYADLFEDGKLKKGIVSDEAEALKDFENGLRTMWNNAAVEATKNTKKVAIAKNATVAKDNNVSTKNSEKSKKNFKNAKKEAENIISDSIEAIDNIYQEYAKKDEETAKRIALDLMQNIENISGLYTNEEIINDNDIRPEAYKEEFKRLYNMLSKNKDAITGSEYAEIKENNNENNLYSFAGRESATADLEMLEKAQQMSKKRASKYDILEKTGWFKGVDGKWRYEIDNSDFELKDNIDTERSYYRLKDLIKDNKLFEAYRNLKNIEITFEELGNALGAYHNTSSGLLEHISLNKNEFMQKTSTEEYLKELYNLYKELETEENKISDSDQVDFFKLEYMNTAITEETKFYMNKSDEEKKKYEEEADELTEKLKNNNKLKTFEKIRDLKEDIEYLEKNPRYAIAIKNKDNLVSVLLHEIQHYIQEKEDFERGSNSGYWNRIVNADEMVLSPAEYNLIHKREKEYRAFKNELDKKYGSDIIYLEFYNNYKNIYETSILNGEENVESYKRYEKSLKDLMKIGGEEAIEDAEKEAKLWDLKERYTNYAIERNRREPFDLYQNTVGEIEARDVQKRLDNKSLFPEVGIQSIKMVSSGRVQNISDEQVLYQNRDSEGNKLTKEQQEYFKDSKVRDEEGNLQIMYHGTAADFTVFDKNKIGKTGAFEGTGFNFTPSEARAKSYGGKVMAVYLNVVNPLSNTKVTISIRELANIVKNADPTGDNIISDYARDTRDYGKQSFINREAITTARNIIEFSDNDTDVYSYLSAGAGGNINLMNEFKKLGYDGVIHYDKSTNKLNTVVVFDSSQIKNIDNLKPTENEDIRYQERYEKALEENNEEEAGKIVEEYAATKGYTQKVYHGTQQFGFTEIDLSKSDDDFSFWTTDSLETASTYSGEENITPVKEGITIGETPEDKIKAYKKVIEEPDLDISYIKADDQLKKKHYLDINLKTIKKDLNRLDEYYKTKEKRTYRKEFWEKTYNELVDLINKEIDTKTVDMELIKKLDNKLYGIGPYNIDLSDELPYLLNGTGTLIDAIQNKKSMYAESHGDYYSRKSEESMEWYIKNSGLTFGNYEFLADLSGDFREIYAYGENWNNIRVNAKHKNYSSKEIIKMMKNEFDSIENVKYDQKKNTFISKLKNGKDVIKTKEEMLDILRLSDKYATEYKRATTRDIVKEAKEQGYDGVIIRRVVDNGGRNYNLPFMIQPANLYIFFNPQQQLKSADPVTYDNEGKIIPLAERFDPDNVDIRFQDRSGQLEIEDFMKNAPESKIKSVPKNHQRTIEEYLTTIKKKYPTKRNIKTTALGITTEFVNNKRIDFRGIQLNKEHEIAAEQIATLAMALRDPRFETFRMFYTKGDEIVATDAVTSYLVSSSLAFKPKNLNDNMIDNHKNRMKRLNADGYFMLHNHPSGDVTESNADRNLTKYFKQNLPGFRGHIIIDHNKYTLLKEYGVKHNIKIKTDIQDNKKRVIDHPLLYNYINTGNIGEIAKNLVHNNDISTVIFADSKLKINAIQEIDNRFILSKDFENYINNRKIDYGSNFAFIVNNQEKTNNTNFKKIVKLLKKGTLDDIVEPEEVEASYRVRENVKVKNNIPTKAYRVFEQEELFQDRYEEKLYKKALAENENYKKLIAQLQRQLELNPYKNLSDADAMKLTNIVVRNTETSMPAKEIRDKIKKAFSLSSTEPLQQEKDLRMLLRPMILEAIDRHENTAKNRSDYANQILSNLRKTRIKLSDTQKQEAAYLYGTYNDWRKHMMGKIIISNNGTDLDKVWTELSSLYPDVFDSEITDTDQPGMLENIINNLKEDYVSDFGLNRRDFADYITTEILTEYVGLKPQKTLAQIKKDYKEEMQEYKKRVREKTRRMRQELREERKEHRKEISILTKNAKIIKQDARDEKKRVRAENQIQRDKEAARHAILRDARWLNTRFLRPNGKNHIQEDVRKPVALFLDAFSENTKVFGNDYLDALKIANTALKNSENEYYANKSREGMYAYIEGIAEELSDSIIGRRLSQLDLQELESLADLLHTFRTLVENETDVFVNGKMRDVQVDGWMLADDLKKNNKPYKSIRFRPAQNARDLIFNNSLKPVYFFRHLGRRAEGLFKHLLEGQDKFAKNLVKARDFVLSAKDTYNYDKWDKDATVKIGDIELNVEQALSVYASYKRQTQNMEQEAKHLFVGGIILDSKMNKIIKDNGQEKDSKIFQMAQRQSEKIGEAEMMQIVNFLTDEQMRYADHMVGYLSNDMAELGNEVSLRMDGWKKFNETYYFPYRSSRDVLSSDTNEKNQGTPSIKNMGFTKALSKRANNTIVISDFTDTCARHINGMLKYNALAEPEDYMNRVFSYTDKKYDEANNVKEYGDNNLTLLKHYFGDGAVAYYNQFKQNLDTGLVKDPNETLYSGFFSFVKKNAVLGNLSVMIQQPSAIGRAMAYIEPKYFIKTAKNNHFSKKKWEEIKKYSGVAILKEIGGWDVSTGKGLEDYITEKQPEGIRKVLDPLDDALGKMPGKMDEITWCHIWDACKAKIKSNTSEASTEEINKMTAKLFDKVINNTQVYDSTLSRSNVMNSKSLFMQMATAFKSEPTISWNMYLEAGREAIKGNKKKAGKLLGAVVFQVALNSLLKALVNGARDKDKDKSYLEKYAKAAADNFASDINPLSMLPFTSEILSIFKGYEVKRTDTDLIYNTYKSIADGLQSDNPKDMILNVASGIGTITGVPIANIIRDIKGIINVSMDILNKNMLPDNFEEVLEAVEEGITDKKVKIQDRVEKYVKSNNEKDLQKIKEELEISIKELHPEYSKDRLKKEVDNRLKARMTQALKSAYVNGSTKEKEKIVEKMKKLNVYKSTNLKDFGKDNSKKVADSWIIQDLKEQYKNADRKNRIEIRKKLYATGHWKKLADLDKQLKKWQ